jgi:hypothetical protein
MVATLAPHNLEPLNCLQYDKNIQFRLGIFCVILNNILKLIAVNSEPFDLVM